MSTRRQSRVSQSESPVQWDRGGVPTGGVSGGEPVIHGMGRASVGSSVAKGRGEDAVAAERVGSGRERGRMHLPFADSPGAIRAMVRRLAGEELLLLAIVMDDGVGRTIDAELDRRAKPHLVGRAERASGGAA